MNLPWRLLPGQLLLHRSWGEETVIYNDVTGATHLVDAGALELLTALRDGTVTAAELAEPDVITLLEQLALLELVEAC
jgi:PqqD family protein of HPr-rel-A system